MLFFPFCYLFVELRHAACCLSGLRLSSRDGSGLNRNIFMYQMLNFCLKNIYKLIFMYDLMKENASFSVVLHERQIDYLSS